MDAESITHNIADIDEITDHSESVRGPARELLEFEQRMEKLRALARSGKSAAEDDINFAERKKEIVEAPSQQTEEARPKEIIPAKKIRPFKLVIPDSGFSIILPAVWMSENQDGLSVIFDDGVKISAELGSRCKISKPNGKEIDALFAISAPLPDKTEMCAFFYCQPDSAPAGN